MYPEQTITMRSSGTVSAKALDYIYRVRQFAAQKTDEALQSQIDIGNDDYRIIVDGKEGYTRSSIYQVRKVVRVNFTGRALSEAARLGVAALQNAVKRYYPENEYIRDKAVSIASVSAFLCEKGKPSQLITNLDDVAVGLNQYVVVTIKRPAGYENNTNFANWFAAHKFGGKGIFERAARNLRRRIGTTRTAGAVRVAAVRIRLNGNHSPLSQNLSNKRPDLKGKIRPIPYGIGTTTNWVLIIEPRRNKGQQF